MYPGCTVPAHRCIAHHIRPWDDRGPTDLTNLVLICHFHHRTVHHGKLAITRTPPAATPPPPPTGHHHPLAARDRAERPDPTDPKPHEAPSDGVRPPPQEAAHPVTEACPQTHTRPNVRRRTGAGPATATTVLPQIRCLRLLDDDNRLSDHPAWACAQVTESVVGEVHQVCHYFVLAGLADIEPPLSSESDHPDQHLRVHRASLVL